MLMDPPKYEDSDSGSNTLKKVSTSTATNAHKMPPIDIPSHRESLARNKGQWIEFPVKPLSSYSADRVPIFSGSPWKQYKQCLYLEIGGPVIVASMMPATRDLFTVRTFSGPEAEEKLYMLRQLKHENLLAPLELFVANDQVFIVSELAAITLDRFTVVSLDETQLAAIIHQVR